LAELTIKDEWGIYKNERFLLYDNKLNSDDRIIIFALDEGLKYLTEAHTLYCDGNFSVKSITYIFSPNFIRKKSILCDYKSQFIIAQNIIIYFIN